VSTESSGVSSIHEAYKEGANSITECVVCKCRLCNPPDSGVHSWKEGKKCFRNMLSSVCMPFGADKEDVNEDEEGNNITVEVGKWIER
jgi:hypothetical protein